jgi:hypothetical protein
MPRCGEAFTPKSISVISVIRTSAVCISLFHQRHQRHQDISGLYFSFASAAISVIRASAVCISFLHSSAKNLMPLRGEAFLFCTFLLRTLCRYAAKHFTFNSFTPKSISVISVIRASAVCISLLHQRNQRNQGICGLYFTVASA